MERIYFTLLAQQRMFSENFPISPMNVVVWKVKTEHFGGNEGAFEFHILLVCI